MPARNERFSDDPNALTDRIVFDLLMEGRVTPPASLSETRFGVFAMKEIVAAAVDPSLIQDGLPSYPLPKKGELRTPAAVEKLVEEFNALAIADCQPQRGRLTELLEKEPDFFFAVGHETRKCLASMVTGKSGLKGSPEHGNRNQMAFLMICGLCTVVDYVYDGDRQSRKEKAKILRGLKPAASGDLSAKVLACGINIRRIRYRLFSEMPANERARAVDGEYASEAEELLGVHFAANAATRARESLHTKVKTTEDFIETAILSCKKGELDS